MASGSRRQQTDSTTHERVACHKVSCLIPAKAVKDTR